jgi:hypothetical protein
MARRLEHLGRVEHLRLGGEAVLVLAVVEARLAPHHDQDRLAAEAQRQRLGDARRLDTVRSGGERDRRGAGRRLEDLDVGSTLGEEGSDGCQAHRLVASTKALGQAIRFFTAC